MIRARSGGIASTERASSARANRRSTAHRRHPLLAGRWVLVVIDTRNHWSYEGGNDEAHRRARCAITRNVLHAVALRHRFWGERDSRNERERSALGSCFRPPCSAPRWRRVEDRVEDDGYWPIAHCLHGTEWPPTALGLRAGSAFAKQLSPARRRMGNRISIRHARVLAHSPCPQRHLRRCVAERLTRRHVCQ